MDASEFLLYLFVLGPLVAAAVFLLSFGPAGWFLVAFLVLGVMAVRALRQDPAERSPDRLMCPACGSPNPTGAGTCDYCGEPLGEPTGGAPSGE